LYNFDFENIIIFKKINNNKLGKNIYNSSKYYFNSNLFHIFQYKNSFFIFSNENLVFFEINKITYKILQIHNPITEFKIKKSLPTLELQSIKEVISELIKWRILNSKLIGDNGNYFSANPFLLEKEEKYYLSGLYLVISQDCNLRCRYCSAEYGHFGKKPKVLFMSKDVAKRSIDFLLENAAEGNKQNLPILFQGGEPLMNFEIIKFVVEYVRTKYKVNANFGLNTNGTLLNDKMAKWLSDNYIDVRFSIDGTEQIHN